MPLDNSAAKWLLLGLCAALLPGRVPAAPVPFTGTLTVEFPSPCCGGATLPIPGAGMVTINGGSGVVTPIATVSIPALAFAGTVGPLAVKTHFSFNSIPASAPLGNGPIVVHAGGTCTAGHPNVSCPGGGLAGFGALAGGPLYMWAAYFSRPIGFIGGGSTVSANFDVASGAGWTTGTVMAHALHIGGTTSPGPTGLVTVAVGSVGPTSLSLVSPIAFTIPLFSPPSQSNGFARISMTLTLVCGDGLLSAGEECDDGNQAPGDGCAPGCQVEEGYECSGAPSVCEGICGNGLIAVDEECDDGNTTAGDGCDASCQIEPGFGCSGEPSRCGVGILGKKLIIVDKLTIANKAKIVYVAKDTTAAKGTTNDPAQISATFDYQLLTIGASGSMAMPGGAGWLVNKETVAKYVNKGAPTGGAVKVAVIKPGKLLKAVGKDLGDGGTKIDIYQGGDPTTPVVAATQYTVIDGATMVRHCGYFTDCVRKLIAGGTGAKVVCKNAVRDDTCAGEAGGCTVVTAPANGALGLPTGKFIDCGNGTVLDTRSGDATGGAQLRWEQKDGDDGSPDPGNLHDVDNQYPWAGCCDGSCNTVADLCQPNAAAEATCLAQAELDTTGCSQCASGTCDVDPHGYGALTTVWGWINQVNAENFAGHADWRLPSQAGSDVTCPGCARELEAILDCSNFLIPSCIIDPIFGPTAIADYWSASTDTGNSSKVWNADFYFGGPFPDDKDGPFRVRAVR